MIAFSSLQM